MLPPGHVAERGGDEDMRFGHSTRSPSGGTLASRRCRWLTAVLNSVMLMALTQGASPALARRECVAEIEPNGQEDVLLSLPGSMCAEGELPPGDAHDLTLWELTVADADTRWTATLEGVQGTLTILQFIPITSPPGEASASILLPCTSSTRSGCASAWDRRISWSDRSARYAAGPRSSVASPGRRPA